MKGGITMLAALAVLTAIFIVLPTARIRYDVRWGYAFASRLCLTNLVDYRITSKINMINNNCYNNIRIILHKLIDRINNILLLTIIHGLISVIPCKSINYAAKEHYAGSPPPYI